MQTIKQQSSEMKTSISGVPSAKIPCLQTYPLLYHYNLTEPILRQALGSR